MKTALRTGAAAAALILALGVTLGWTAASKADGVTDGNGGRAALLAGNPDEAIRLFTRAITAGGLTAKNQAVTLNLRGNAYLEKGQTELALSDLNESLRLAETPDARFTRAKILIAQFRLDDAIDDLNKTMQDGGTAADVWTLRGHAELYAGRLDAAVKDLDQALRLDPTNGFAFRTRGHVFMNMGQDDKAIADETKAIQLDSKDIEAHWLRAYAYRYRKKDLAKAVIDHSAALAIDPQDSSNRTSRADIYEEMGRYPEAAADYDEWIKQNPKGAFGYWARGRLNLMQGKAALAAPDLAKAVSLKPSDAYNVLWLHMARVKAGTEDAAELTANAAKANRAVWPGPLLDYLTGKADAATVMTKAQVGEGKAKAAQACEAQTLIGQDLLAKGKKPEAVEKLQAAMRTCDGTSREAKLVKADLQRSGAPVPASPKPILASTAPSSAATVPAAKAVATPAVLKSPAAAAAAVMAPPKPRPKGTQVAQADPLGLRGSLK
jgi:tetratricopeptide (TPR) repeat protein